MIKIYENLVSFNTCDKIISLYKSGVFKEDNQENKLESLIYSSKVTSDPDWELLLEDLKNSSISKIKEYLNLFSINTPEMYLFSHAGVNCLKNNKAIPYHYDIEVSYFQKNLKISHFAVLVYLNEDFDGGDLVFPLQNITIRPKKGMTVIFPTSFLYPHAVSPVFLGERYMVRMSYVLNKDF
jgi:predicted 2-oxoglutarate/Fe(II)-dependent dioxygenase YbiX